MTKPIDKLVDDLNKSNINFVPIPTMNEEDKVLLLTEMRNRLKLLENVMKSKRRRGTLDA